MSKIDYVLILREVALHPHSTLLSLEKSFEKPSIVHVVSKDGLRAYQKPPVYDEKYLAIFDSIKVFESNISFINFNVMFPVVLCTTGSMVEDAKAVCQQKALPFRVFVNEFSKENAYELVRNLASEEVPKAFCEALVKRVGLSPQRIISAIMVCDQVGYNTSNISKYIDKYIYIDVFDVIESLLGICRSKAQMKRAALYLHMNRLWYKRYTQGILVKEVSSLIKIYRDLIDGTLNYYTLQTYIDTEHISRYRVLYTIDLFERVSLAELMILEKFLSGASLLEVTMHLS